MSCMVIGMEVEGGVVGSVVQKKPDWNMVWMLTCVGRSR